MAKKTTKKLRMSGVVDHTTMGLNLGTYVELSEGCYKKLRQAMNKANKKGIPSYNADIKRISGVELVGSAIYLLTFLKKNGDTNTIHYEFRESNNDNKTTYFMNVSGNPTCLVSGDNDVPVLVKTEMFPEAKNTAIRTFMYLNRVMYLVLGTLLKDYEFKWSAEDFKRIMKGDISIKSYQLAWYSADMGNDRAGFFNLLRAGYAALDATKDKVVSAAKAMNLTTRVWDNNDLNLTIEARTNRNKEFSLTFYAKDQEPGSKSKNKERVSQLIRWDCTLNYQFLANKGMKTISEMEEQYIKICDNGTYDASFVKYLSNKVQERIKLPHLLNLTVDSYRESVQKMEELEGKNEKKISKYWLNHGEIKETEAETAKAIDIKPSRYSSLKPIILEKTGIDITIPRATYAAILESRVLATRTLMERDDYVEAKHTRSNKIVPWQELVERDKEIIINYKKHMEKGEQFINIRKFSAKTFSDDNIWIYRL